MKAGQRVVILDHPQATRWHKALVGTVTTVTGESHLVKPWGRYYNLAVCEDPIAGICLRPVDDPSEFQSFMERVLKPVKLPKEITA